MDQEEERTSNNVSLSFRAGIYQTQLHNPGETGSGRGSGPVILKSRGTTSWCLTSSSVVFSVCLWVTSVIKDDLLDLKPPGEPRQPIAAHILVKLGKRKGRFEAGMMLKRNKYSWLCSWKLEPLTDVSPVEWINWQVTTKVPSCRL